MKILNLYAGIGGNRKLWEGHSVTAVELNEKIAAVYKDQHPNDEVIIADAHQYLLDNYEKFDGIWSSPPCQGETKMMKFTRHNLRRYPTLTMYQEIIFLQHFFKGFWVVENVVPYYEPLIKPTVKCGRHLFWANFPITPLEIKQPKNTINLTSISGKQVMMDWLGIHYKENIYYEGNHCPAQVLRNCVHPDLGLHILNCSQECYSVAEKPALTLF
jgi:DNA (cytosine-5)-methyltransferase 1